MKKSLLIITFISALVLSGQQPKPAEFSVTDTELLNLIIESPTFELGIAVDNTFDSGNPVYNVYNSIELYHVNFLSSVNRLREAVMLKNNLIELEKSQPELRQNPELWKLIVNTYYLRAYPDADYSEMYRTAEADYRTFLEFAQKPDVFVYSGYNDPEEYDENYKVQMLASAKKIIENLAEKNNAEANRKLADEGRVYYQKLVSK